MSTTTCIRCRQLVDACSCVPEDPAVEAVLRGELDVTFDQQKGEIVAATLSGEYVAPDVARFLLDRSRGTVGQAIAARMHQRAAGR